MITETTVFYNPNQDRMEYKYIPKHGGCHWFYIGDIGIAVAPEDINTFTSKLQSLLDQIKEDSIGRGE
jgi:hypothetical protein